MDVIKYRAWGIDSKEYLSDSFLKQLFLAMDGKVYWFSWSGIKDISKSYKIEFYTRLKDKNGKEIYEGDIIIYNVRVVSKGKQTFKEKQIVCDLSNFELLHTLYCLSTTRNLEIIGNINENKELLK